MSEYSNIRHLESPESSCKVRLKTDSDHIMNIQVPEPT